MSTLLAIALAAQPAPEQVPMVPRAELEKEQRLVASLKKVIVSLVVLQCTSARTKIVFNRGDATLMQFQVEAAYEACQGKGADLIQRKLNHNGSMEPCLTHLSKINQSILPHSKVQMGLLTYDELELKLNSIADDGGTACRAAITKLNR